MFNPNRPRKILLPLFKAIVCAVILTFSSNAQGQKKSFRGSPVRKDSLLQVLNSKQFKPPEVIAIIEKHGVNFQLNPVIEKELKTHGASAEVVEAVRQNSRKDDGSVWSGMINARAKNLTQPSYPPAAKVVRASGAVNVLVSIDENGNVTDATATSGHPLLRSASEAAALASKFEPTIVKGKPVKVSGTVVYNFVLE